MWATATMHAGLTSGMPWRYALLGQTRAACSDERPARARGAEQRTVGRVRPRVTQGSTATTRSSATGCWPEFGYRLLADEFERAGHLVGECPVWWLCSQHELWSATVGKGRRGSAKTPGPAVHDDHLQREFSALGPIRCGHRPRPEDPTAQGKLYRCAIRSCSSTASSATPWTSG
jgi:hypothetical protein